MKEEGKRKEEEEGGGGGGGGRWGGGGGEEEVVVVVAMMVVCLFVSCLTSQQHASVSQGRICSDNFRAATLRQKLQIQLSIPHSHSILTPGQPVPVLTL